MTFTVDTTSATGSVPTFRLLDGAVGRPADLTGQMVVEGHAFRLKHSPMIISRAQAYYWTNRWQEDEAASLTDLEAGDAETFHSGRDAVRWLLAADDD